MRSLNPQIKLKLKCFISIQHGTIKDIVGIINYDETKIENLNLNNYKINISLRNRRQNTKQKIISEVIIMPKNSFNKTTESA